MANAFGKLGEVTIAPSGSDATIFWDFGVFGKGNAKIGVLLVYDAVDATTGCTLIVPTAMGNANIPTDSIGPLTTSTPWVRYATPDPALCIAPTLAAPVLISNALDPLDGKFVSLTEFTLIAAELSRMCNFQLQNNDAVNACRASIFVNQ